MLYAVLAVEIPVRNYNSTLLSKSIWIVIKLWIYYLLATTVQTFASDNVQSTSNESNDNCLKFKPIGIIETSFPNKRGVPRQPTIMAKSKGVIVIDQSVFNNPEHALCGLEEFSHIW